MAKVLVSVPDQLLSQIDEVAEAECRTRSELLRESFRLYLKMSIVQKHMEVTRDQEE